MGLKPGQEQCINTLDRSIVVAAGAGSGKTFTLTKRIVRAIEQKKVDGIERVCAITFTNKAAGELKSRIKAELRACGMQEQALHVDEAWVSTIHGMCARILRAHAVELDIDPAFAMIDPADASDLRDRSIEEMLKSAQGELEGSSGGLGLSRGDIDGLFSEYPARSYGPRSTSVESMVRSLMDAANSHVDGFGALILPKTSVNPARLVDVVLEAYEALVDVAAGQNPTDEREAWMASATERVSAIRESMQSGNVCDVLWALRALDQLKLPKRNGKQDYKNQIADAGEIHDMCVMELRLAAAAPHLDTLVALARAAQALYEDEKRAQGVLDNNDLLVMAFKAITQNPAIAAQYRDKFQLIMVDEFQDTDQMQVDMIKELAGPGACRLCTVGDAQQSIYRFRGADVAVYRRHLEEVRANDPADVIMLPDNFRSHPDVLSLVDRVFERPEMFGGEFMSLAPGRDEGRVKQPFCEGVPRVQVQLTSNSYRGASSMRVRQEAAGRIADAFADLRSRGHGAGEMAVLLGSMSHADVYAAALRERGLACVISGGSVFARAPEVQVVSDLVEIAANPGQTQSLYNVFAGPLFELNPDDLLELATSIDEGGRYRRRALDKGLEALMRTVGEEGAPATWSAQLQSAVRVMGGFVESGWCASVSQRVFRAVVDSGWLTRLQNAGPEGMAVAANVYKAVRMIGDIESSGGMGPAQVARAFKTMLAESKEAPGALSATGGDFVRIMTVHASKGLEFPIVAVAEFKEVAGNSSKLLASEVGGKIYLSLDLGNTLAALGGSANLKSVSSLYASMMEGRVDEDELADAIEHADGALSMRAALYEQDRIGDCEEAKRLLYVALTRAKEALVVSLMGMRTKDNPYATPKSCLGALVPALAGPEGGFEEGVTRFDYRGSSPALVEHVALQAQDDATLAELADGAQGNGGEQAAMPCMCEEPFFVALPEPRQSVARAPMASGREGVFSYSSVAEASHEADVLERLAERFFVSADAAADDVSAGLWLGASADAGNAFAVPWADLPGNWAASMGGEEEAPSQGASALHDADRATDLGTAFHRLAQYAVVTRRGAALVRPPEARIGALAKSCQLGDAQRVRLESALDRWFGCNLAAEMGTFADLRAEVPFFIGADSAHRGIMPDEACEARLDSRVLPSAFLEGEIDLLGLSEGGRCASVVDYKTGGSADESSEKLALKHVLQAACYAYAVMEQGVERVDATFVRVERPQADDPSQPQCVRYRFEASDLPDLKQAIFDCYAAAQARG